ncbi:MAG: energy transducer TonB [Acidobacteriota bacterium]
MLAGKLITQVIPKYPDLARRMRVSGTVQLLGIIGKDGRVRALRVVEGHPMLRQSALDAVNQWIYSPTILNGQPVEVEAPIEVRFTLQ